MSRGGEFAYTWATANPDKVSCIYADNPGGNRDLLRNSASWPAAMCPCCTSTAASIRSSDKYSTAIESIYHQLGGRISVMIKEGAGHHPHSLRDPGPIADFIVQSVSLDASRNNRRPEYLSGRIARTSFYSIESSYRDFPKERMPITCRGPQFTECYDRFEFEVGGVEGFVTVIIPKAAASGKPWVYRAGFVDRDALVDLALLAKGFHVVVGPVPYNADGPSCSIGTLFTSISSATVFPRSLCWKAPACGGEVYAWAIENPDKVSCVYAENPVLRSHMSKKPLLENLAPLAKAGVPLLHVCGILIRG